MRRKSIWFSSIVAASLIAALSYAPPAMAQPPPGGAWIRSVTFSGPACPAGSATAALNLGGRALGIDLSDVHAEVGPGLPLSAGNKQCTAILELTRPPGWTYGITAINGVAPLRLDRGVNGRIRVRVSFPGGPEMRGEVRIQGLADGRFRLRPITSEALWMPCGNALPLVVTTTVALDNTATPAASGELIGDLGVTLTLRWRRC
jgi:hypothetical protein